MQAIPVEAARRTAAKLDDELGRSDLKRLELLLSLIQPDSLANLGEALEKLFPGQGREAGLTAFRQFRKRLNDAAKVVGINLTLDVDSRKKDDPGQRRCWFTGEDGAAEAAARLIEEESAFVQRSEQGAYELRGDKPVIRYFISFAHTDDKLKKDLCLRLEKLFKIANKYVFEAWDDSLILSGDRWREQIAAAIDNCHFGLLLITPAFLGREFITQHELPAFVPGNLARPETGKRAIPVALEPLLFDGSIDLKGLQNFQIFQDSESKAFSQRTGTKRDEFASALFQQILRVIDLRLSPPIRPESDRNRMLEHHFRKEIECQLEGCNFVPTEACSSTLDKLEAAARTGGGPAQRIDALNYLFEWANDPKAPPYFALLGELGLGKTTTCLAFARELLTRRQADPGLPLPIYLDLRHLGEKAQKEPGLETIIQEILPKSWRGGQQRIDLRPDEMIRLVREQGAVAIFDGLDEVLVHLSAAGGQRFVRELLRLLPPLKVRGKQEKGASKKSHGRLLLSCRTHYFRTLREQKNLLLGEDREPLGADDYRALVLMPFTEAQILLYLKQTLPDQDPERIMETIRAVHNLPEMAERPYTLSLIAREIPQIERWKLEGRTVTGVTLYRHMVQSWLERDIGKHQLIPTHKQRLMEHFAAALWRSGRRTWKIEDVEQWLIDFFLAHPEIAAHYEGKDRELLKEDLRTATFLVREGEDQFRFAHTSLLEFFLAGHLYRGLLENDASRWAMPLVSRETFGFLGQLLTEDESGREIGLAALRVLLRDGYLAKASEQALAYGLLAHEQNYPAPVLAGARLDGADLRGWQFGNRDGQRLNMRGSVWRETRLDGAKFHNLDLDQADFSRCALDRVEFIACGAIAAVFVEAGLTGAVFRDDNLTAADFSGALAYRVKYLRCNLQDAKAVPRKAPQAFLALNSPTAIKGGGLYKGALSGAAVFDVFSGHNGSVNGVAYSPDGRMVATASEDQTVRLWETSSGECTLVLRGHEGAINDVAYSPDGRMVATASNDQTVRLWKTSSGECVLVLRGNGGRIDGVAYSPDGLALATASEDYTVRLWETSSGECLKVLRGHKGWVNGVAYSPDGQEVATASEDKTVRLWATSSGECLLVLHGHEGGINGVAFSPDGLMVATVSNDKTMRIWDLKNNEREIFQIAHDEEVNGLAFSPDGRFVTTVAGDKVRLWDVILGECSQTLCGHYDQVIDVVYSPDGRILATVSEDHSLCLWNLSKGECDQVMRGSAEWIRNVSYLPDGRIVVTKSEDSIVCLWEGESGRFQQTLDTNNEWVLGLGFLQNGICVATLSNENTVHLWDTTRGITPLDLRGHEKMVMGAVFSHDCQIVATYSGDTTVRLWEASGGKCLHVLPGHQIWARGAAFSPDGLGVATTSFDNEVRLWNVLSGKCVHILKGHEEQIEGVAYSPNGRILATTSADETVRLWETSSGECLQVLFGHEGWVLGAAYSPDGRVVATASADQTIRLWETSSGDCLQILRGHEGGVRGVAYSPDGLVLASWSNDGSLHLWNTVTGQLLRQINFFNDGSWATLDIKNNKIVQVYGDAWRWLGWRGPDQSGRMERWPAESFGPLPEWTEKGNMER